jgi:hypothetical protein
VEILVQAWKTLGEDILTDDQIRQVIERIDNKDMQLCWHYDESRSYWWVGKGLDESTATKAYTYRRSRELDCEESFPNEQWNAFISAVQDIVDESSTTRIAHDIALAYEKNTFDKFRPRKRYDLTMTLDLTMGDFPVDMAAVTCLLKTLGAVLQSLCLGKAGTLYQEVQSLWVNISRPDAKPGYRSWKSYHLDEGLLNKCCGGYASLHQSYIATSQSLMIRHSR